MLTEPLLSSGSLRLVDRVRRIGLPLVVVAALTSGCVDVVLDIDVESDTESGTESDQVDPQSEDGASDLVDEGPDENIGAEAVPVPGVQIDRVIDGDSIDVILPDGNEAEVRLVGYNAPELFNNDQRTCNGEQARVELEAVLARSEQLSILDEGDDRYGRLLADISLDPDDEHPTVVAALVASGTGLATGDDETHRRLMLDAAAQRLGMWGNQCGEPQSRDLAIGATQVNPDGNDRFNLGEEWVVIENRSSSEIALDGWVLRDDTTGHRFTLAGGLPASGSLKVRTGDGTSDGENLYLGENFPVWSNQWETVLLIDPQGVLAHWVFVG